MRVGCLEAARLGTGAGVQLNNGQPSCSLAEFTDSGDNSPTINPRQKSARRSAFHMLRAGRDDTAHLARAILDVKDKLGIRETR